MTIGTFSQSGSDIDIDICLCLEKIHGPSATYVGGMMHGQVFGADMSNC